MARPGSLVTVFGGSGFVGAQVVRALLRADHRVRIAVRNPNLAFESQTQGRVGQIQRVACDVTDESQVAAALEGATAAVNLVGILFETPWRRKHERRRSEGPAPPEEHSLESGAQKRTRTSTTFRPLAPEASASTNSATWARPRGAEGADT